MNGFIGLTKRNMLLFFKDRQAVLFSLMTSIIVLVLYILFLKGTFVDAMNGALMEYPGIGDLIKESDVDMFANLILLTGILGSAMITVPYNCLTTVVSDREKKIDYDILSTPLRRGQIILSYFLSSALSSVILTGVILTAGLLLIRGQGDLYMDAQDVVKTYGLVALGSVSATALFMIVVLMFKSSSACGAFFGILSAAAGFVIGVYIPISQFSDGVQTICNIFPASQVTIVLRNLLVGGILDNMNATMGGLDQGMFAESMREVFSFKANMFGHGLEISQMIIYILIALVLCLVAQVIIYSKNYKKK